jgi:hypothetical protein
LITSESDTSTAHNGSTEILRHVLKERMRAVEHNPNLVRSDLLTQSGVYYETRPKLIASGIDVSKVGKLFEQISQTG